MRRVRVSRAALLVSLIVIVAACASPTPAAPAPTSPPAPTSAPTEPPPPTSTPVPPTATLVPTNTPVPRPSLSRLMFADNPNMTNAQPYGAKFDFGVQAIYAGLDFANLPAKSNMKWTLTRDDYDVLTTFEYLTATTGSTTRVLVDQPRLLLPGTYNLVAAVGKASVSAVFIIDVTGTKPGTTLMTERFDDNDLAWGVYSDSIASARVQQGQMQISVDKADSYANSLLPMVLADLDVSVAAQRTGGPRDGYYGILFRYIRDRGYVFEVTDDGYFNVATQTPSAYTPLIDWTRSSAIKTGQVNFLRVVASGNKFAFYINEQQVATLSDSQYQHGSIGFVAGDFKQAGMKVNFDDVLVAMPQGSTLVVMPTKAATAVPRGTPAPKPTPAPQKSPLRDVVARALKAVEAIGGAMDRLYGGGGSEACAPLVSDYLLITSSPEYDVSAQPGNVQAAYGPYRQAVQIIKQKVAPIYHVCSGGGGTVGKLDFDVARQAINEAGSLLTQALNSLGQ